MHHKEVKAAEGIKIAAQNLENAVAGTQMLVVQKGDSIEDLKEEVMGDMTDIFKSVDKSGKGCVQQFFLPRDKLLYKKQLQWISLMLQNIVILCATLEWCLE